MTEEKFKKNDSELSGVCPSIVRHNYHNMTAHDYDVWLVGEIEREKKRLVHVSSYADSEEHSKVMDEIKYWSTVIEKKKGKIKWMNML